MNRSRTRFLTQAAVIAALYAILTFLSALLGLDGKSFIQLRLSEALCVLPCFTAAAIPGLPLGCLLAGLLTGAAPTDLLFGTLATLLGALGTYALRSHRVLALIPPVAANTLILPPVIAYAYLGEETAVVSLPLLFLSVGASEFIAAGLLGFLLYSALSPYRNRLFK